MTFFRSKKKNICYEINFKKKFLLRTQSHVKLQICFWKPFQNGVFNGKNVRGLAHTNCSLPKRLEPSQIHLWSTIKGVPNLDRNLTLSTFLIETPKKSKGKSLLKLIETCSKTEIRSKLNLNWDKMIRI